MNVYVVYWQCYDEVFIITGFSTPQAAQEFCDEHNDRIDEGWYRFESINVEVEDL
ncbi:hypothetical protein [Lapidilactobacillus bayanensis]|jgi:hypothetical protein|uniref:hypothetical protein n=1 Tax=Lapidilactobacillus bayanensis TaxID=2485998 RepID=UPI0013DDBE9B|nr:hypothetical protein [Lapidilactobacillus bayanensis]